MTLVSRDCLIGHALALLGILALLFLALGGPEVVGNRYFLDVPYFLLFAGASLLLIWLAVRDRGVMFTVGLCLLGFAFFSMLTILPSAASLERVLGYGIYPTLGGLWVLVFGYMLNEVRFPRGLRSALLLIVGILLVFWSVFQLQTAVQTLVSDLHRAYLWLYLIWLSIGLFSTVVPIYTRNSLGTPKK